MSSQIVRLNVGGKIFRTKKATLKKFDGFFKTILETNVPVVTDELESIYIQRDPKHFRLILNFLRHGSVRVPSSRELNKEIRDEAEFYLLFDLMDLCDAKLAAADGKAISNAVSEEPLLSYLLSYWKKRIANEYNHVEREIESVHLFLMQLLS